jgi:flagellin
MVNLNNINNQISSSSASILEKLSTGLAINKASDNASGIAIADNINMKSNSLSQAIENANSGIAMSNIADSGLKEQKSILENIQKEVIKANNGTMSEQDRSNISKQIEKFVGQFNAISEQTNYNGNSLLSKDNIDVSNNDLSVSLEDGTMVKMESSDTKAIAVDISSFLSDFSTNKDSRDSLLDAISKGMEKITSYQSDYASATNQLESSIKNSLSTRTNMENAKSEIMDIDYSKEITNFNKSNIQEQIGSFVKVQSNASMQRVLGLLS